MKTKKTLVTVLLLISAASVHAYHIENAKWLPGIASFYLDLGPYNNVAARELAQWDQYTGNTHLRTTSIATTDGGVWWHDGRTSVIWSDDVGYDLPGNILGVCAFYNLSSLGVNDGIIREADIVINTDFASVFATGYYDIGRVLLHEIGHAIGLDHSQFGDAVMSPYIFPGATAELTADDIAGARFLYGPRTSDSLPDNGSTVILLAGTLVGLLGFQINKQTNKRK